MTKTIETTATKVEKAAKAAKAAKVPAAGPVQMEIPSSQVEELTQEATQLEQQLVVFTRVPLEKRDMGWYEKAVTFLKPCRDLQKSITDFFAPMKKKAHEAHREICDREAAQLALVNGVIKQGTVAINAFLTLEHQKKVEADRKQQLENEAAAAKEREKLLAKAEKAQAKGQTEKAESLAEMAEDVYVAPIQQTVAPVGVKTADVTAYSQMETEVQVVDIEAFLRALLASNYKPTMVTIGAGPLKAWVKANDITRFAGLNIRKVPKARIK